MKKLSILMTLAMVMTVAGVASANTIVIPFFNDGGSLATETAAGMRTFIRVKNLDSATIVCAITYVDVDGLDGTPVDNTFVLAPLATVGFRPIAVDSAAEGAAGVLVPDASGGTFSAWGGGGASIASANNIAGMMSEENYYIGSGGGGGLAPAL